MFNTEALKRFYKDRYQPPEPGRAQTDLFNPSHYQHSLLTFKNAGTVEQKPINDLAWPESQQAIVISADAGMGKTSLTKHILYEWSLGQLWPMFDYVFRVELDRFKVVEGKTDLQVLAHAIHSSSRKVIDADSVESLLGNLNKEGEDQKKILLILDGYDECPSVAKERVDAIINARIGGIWSKAYRLVTSRPESKPEIGQEYGIAGLHLEQIKAYIQQVRGEDATAWLNRVEARPELIHLFSNPLYLSIACTLDKDQLEHMSLPVLYQRYVERNLEKAVEAGKETIQDAQDRLSKKAYATFKGNVLSFPVGEGEGHYLRSGLFEEWSRNELRFELKFKHKTLQEYLAAHYVKAHLLEEQAVIEHLIAQRDNPNHLQFFKMLAGLLNGEQEATEQTYWRLLSYPVEGRMDYGLESKQRFFMKLLSELHSKKGIVQEMDEAVTEVILSDLPRWEQDLIKTGYINQKIVDRLVEVFRSPAASLSQLESAAFILNGIKYRLDLHQLTLRSATMVPIPPIQAQQRSPWLDLIQGCAQSSWKIKHVRVDLIRYFYTLTKEELYLDLLIDLTQDAEAQQHAFNTIAACAHYHFDKTIEFLKSDHALLSKVDETREAASATLSCLNWGGNSPQKMVDAFIQMLQSSDKDTKEAAVRALGNLPLKEEALIEKVAQCLLALLKEEDLQWSAAHVLQNLPLKEETLKEVTQGLLAQLKERRGRGLAGYVLMNLPLKEETLKEVAHGLLALLQGTDKDTKEAAARALEKLPLKKLKEKALIDKVAQGFVDLLKEEDWDIRQVAARALGELPLKEEALKKVTQSLLDLLKGPTGLLDLLQSGNKDTKEAAARALGNLPLKEEALIEKVIEGLLTSLQGPDKDIKKAAARALGNLPLKELKKEALIEKIAQGLLAFCQSTELVQGIFASFQGIEETAQALVKLPLKELKEEALIKKIAHGLLALLPSGNEHTKQATVAALVNLPLKEKALKELEQGLFDLLRSGDRDTKLAAAKALVNLPLKEKALKEVEQGLFDLLRSGDECTKLAAAKALGTLPLKEETFKEVVEALLAGFKSGDESTKREAVYALTNLPLKEEALIEKVIKGLLVLLQTKEDHTKWVAARALVKLPLKEEALIEEVVQGLRALLGSECENTKVYAAKALVKLPLKEKVLKEVAQALLDLLRSGDRNMDKDRDRFRGDDSCLKLDVAYALGSLPLKEETLNEVTQALLTFCREGDWNTKRLAAEVLERLPLQAEILVLGDLSYHQIRLKVAQKELETWAANGNNLINGLGELEKVRYAHRDSSIYQHHLDQIRLKVAQKALKAWVANGNNLINGLGELKKIQPAFRYFQQDELIRQHMLTVLQQIHIQIQGQDVLNDWKRLLEQDSDPSHYSLMRDLSKYELFGEVLSALFKTLITARHDASSLEILSNYAKQAQMGGSLTPEGMLFYQGQAYPLGISLLETYRAALTLLSSPTQNALSERLIHYPVMTQQGHVGTMTLVAGELGMGWRNIMLFSGSQKIHVSSYFEDSQFATSRGVWAAIALKEGIDHRYAIYYFMDRIVLGMLPKDSKSALASTLAWIDQEGLMSIAYAGSTLYAILHFPYVDLSLKEKLAIVGIDLSAYLIRHPLHQQLSQHIAFKAFKANSIGHDPIVMLYDPYDFWQRCGHEVVLGTALDTFTSLFTTKLLFSAINVKNYAVLSVATRAGMHTGTCIARYQVDAVDWVTHFLVSATDALVGAAVYYHYVRPHWHVDNWARSLMSMKMGLALIAGINAVDAAVIRPLFYGIRAYFAQEATTSPSWDQALATVPPDLLETLSQAPHYQPNRDWMLSPSIGATLDIEGLHAVFKDWVDLAFSKEGIKTHALSRQYCAVVDRFSVASESLFHKVRIPIEIIESTYDRIRQLELEKESLHQQLQKEMQGSLGYKQTKKAIEHKDRDIEAVKNKREFYDEGLYGQLNKAQIQLLKDKAICRDAVQETQGSDYSMLVDEDQYSAKVGYSLNTLKRILKTVEYSKVESCYTQAAQHRVKFMTQHLSESYPSEEIGCQGFGQVYKFPIALNWLDEHLFKADVLGAEGVGYQGHLQKDMARFCQIPKEIILGCHYVADLQALELIQATLATQSSSLDDLREQYQQLENQTQTWTGKAGANCHIIGYVLEDYCHPCVQDVCVDSSF